MYVASGVIVLAAAAYRYWVAKKARRTFSTSLDPTGGRERPAVRPLPTAAGGPGSVPTAHVITSEVSR